MSPFIGEIKTLEWEASYFILSSMMGVFKQPFAFQEYLERKAGWQSSLEEREALIQKAKAVYDQWTTLLDTMPVSTEADLTTTLVGMQNWVRGFKVRLLASGEFSEAELTGSDTLSSPIDWTALEEFTISDMDRIRGQLFYRRLCGMGAGILTYPLHCRAQLAFSLSEVDSLTGERLRMMGYTLTQALIEASQNFSELEDWFNPLRKLRDFWAHPAPERRFPSGIVSPEDDRFSWNNESIALGLSTKGGEKSNRKTKTIGFSPKIGPNPDL